MPYVTHCPSCGTAFKIVDDQLRIAQGWVRCGHCQAVYKAQEHLSVLIDEPAAVTPPPASAPTPQAAHGAPSRLAAQPRAEATVPAPTTTPKAETPRPANSASTPSPAAEEPAAHAAQPQPKTGGTTATDNMLERIASIVAAKKAAAQQAGKTATTTENTPIKAADSSNNAQKPASAHTPANADVASTDSNKAASAPAAPTTPGAAAAPANTPAVASAAHASSAHMVDARQSVAPDTAAPDEATAPVTSAKPQTPPPADSSATEAPQPEQETTPATSANSVLLLEQSKAPSPYPLPQPSAPPAFLHTPSPQTSLQDTSHPAITAEAVSALDAATPGTIAEAPTVLPAPAETQTSQPPKTDSDSATTPSAQPADATDTADAAPAPQTDMALQPADQSDKANGQATHHANGSTPADVLTASAHTPPAKEADTPPAPPALPDPAGNQEAQAAPSPIATVAVAAGNIAESKADVAPPAQASVANTAAISATSNHAPSENKKENADTEAEAMRRRRARREQRRLKSKDAAKARRRPKTSARKQPSGLQALWQALLSPFRSSKKQEAPSPAAPVQQPPALPEKKRRSDTNTPAAEPVAEAAAQEPSAAKHAQQALSAPVQPTLVAEPPLPPVQPASSSHAEADKAAAAHATDSAATAPAPSPASAAAVAATTPGPTAEADPIPAAATPIAAEDFAFMRDAQRRAFWRRPQVRAALLAGIATGLLTLAGQWAYHHRASLAARIPLARSAFEALRWQVPAWQNIQAIEIEDSDFLRNPDDSYQLRVSLRNSSTHPVAIPALELALLDDDEQLVAKRVIVSDPALPTPALLPPRGQWDATTEIIVQLPPALAQRGISGYRIAVFYP